MYTRNPAAKFHQGKALKLDLLWSITVLWHAELSSLSCYYLVQFFKENLLKHQYTGKKSLFNFHQDYSNIVSALWKSTSSTLLPRDQVSPNPWHPMCPSAKGKVRKGTGGNYRIRRREAMFTLSIRLGPTKQLTRGSMCRISRTTSKEFLRLVRL